MSNKHTGGSYIKDGLQRIKIWDGTYEVEIDELGYLVSIDAEHHKTHEGYNFLSIHSVLGDTSDTLLVRFEAPDTSIRYHLVFTIDVALAATAELWSDSTSLHVSGNAITVTNRDFNSSNTSDMTICHTPSAADGGAAHMTQYIGSTTVSGRIESGGETGGRGEFVLKQGSAYLLKVTSRADANAMTIKVFWYEV